MLTLARRLADRFDVTLAFRSGAAATLWIDRAARSRLRVLSLDSDEPSDPGLLGRFDLLHIHAGIGWEGHGLARAGRRAGVPRLIRTEHLPYVITDRAQAQDHAAGVSLVDRVICVSQASAESFGTAGVAADKLAVVHNGVEPASPARDRAAIRRELAIGDDAPVCLMIARFTAQKGHAVLLQAMPLILRRRPTARFVLVGSGPFEAECRARARDLGVTQAALFLGRREDVPDLLAMADLLVLPSTFEGLPLVILEAMAAGLAVVASRIGGVDEAVEDGRTGWLVPCGDPAALSDAVLSVLDDPAHGDMGRAGQMRFAALFTAQRMAAETQAVYLQAVSSAGGVRRKDIMDRLRIGFIGAGGIAQRHLGVLEHFADVEVAAFTDPLFDRARDGAARFGARAFETHVQMLDACALDAVFICVPPFAHGHVERAVIARGLPFFVEKPLAADLATAEAIAESVEQAGLVTAVGYHWRYLDTVDEAQGVVADNPVQFVSGYWLDATPPPAWWWRQDRSGGQMVEQATHIVDLARTLVGEIDEVFGLCGHRDRADFSGLDVATASTASLRFAGGAVGNIGATCLLRWGHRIGLHLFADSLAIELSEHEIMIDVGRGRPTRRAEGDPVERQDRAFVDAVLGRPNRIRCSYAEALRTQRVTAGIVESAQTRRPVALSARTRELAHE